MLEAKSANRRLEAPAVSNFPPPFSRRSIVELNFCGE
jgi:hypothetical protein